MQISKADKYEEELAKARERLFPQRKRIAHNGPGSMCDSYGQSEYILDQQNLVQDFGELLGVQNIDFKELQPRSKSRYMQKAKRTKSFPLLQKSQKHFKDIKRNVHRASKQRAHVSSLNVIRSHKSKHVMETEMQYSEDCQQNESFGGFYRHGIAENVKNRRCKNVFKKNSLDCDKDNRNTKVKEKLLDNIENENSDKVGENTFVQNSLKKDKKHRHKRKAEFISQESLMTLNAKKKLKKAWVVVIKECCEISKILEFNKVMKHKLESLTINLTSLSVTSAHINTEDISIFEDSSPSTLTADSDNEEQLDAIPEPECPLTDFRLTAPIENEANDTSLEADDSSDDDVVLIEEPSNKFNVQISKIFSTPEWEIKKENADTPCVTDPVKVSETVQTNQDIINLSDDESDIEIEILEVKTSQTSTKDNLNPKEIIESSCTDSSISIPSTLKQLQTNTEDEISNTGNHIENNSSDLCIIDKVQVNSTGKLDRVLSENKVSSCTSKSSSIGTELMPHKEVPPISDKLNLTHINQMVKSEKDAKYENIEDELDASAISNILNLEHMKQPTISPLLELFEKESKELQNIQYAVKNYSNVAAGLKMLEEDKIKRLKYMTFALKKFESSKQFVDKKGFNQHKAFNTDLKNILNKKSISAVNERTVDEQLLSILTLKNCGNSGSGTDSKSETDNFKSKAGSSHAMQSVHSPVSVSACSSNRKEEVALLERSNSLNKSPSCIVPSKNGSNERRNPVIGAFQRPPPPSYSSSTSTISSSANSKLSYGRNFHESPEICTYEKTARQPTHHRTEHPQPVQDLTKVSSANGRLCEVCGKKAVFACQGCSKFFFCSNVCGVSYWNKGHYAVC